MLMYMLCQADFRRRQFVSIPNYKCSPDRSGVYLQCHAVYTAATLQPKQCTCSIGCSYTSDTLQTAVYTVTTLHVHWSYLDLQGWIHCIYTADCSVHFAYTVYTLHIHCSELVIKEWIHCIYTAGCSAHCAYTV